MFFEEASLKLRIAQISDVRKSFEIKRDVHWLQQHLGKHFSELNFSHDFLGRFEVYRMYQNVFLSGQIETSALVACCCCLKEFEIPITSDFSMTFVPASKAPTQDEVNLSVEDMDLSFYREDEINLFEIITEQIALSLPMKFTCNERCKGLCSQCGVDLNIETCHCIQKDMDPRWEALKHLKL